MTLREFIERYPDDRINIMSPGGYTNLLPDESKAFCNGKSVSGNPGDAELAMEIMAEELLPQIVYTATFSCGIWRLLIGYKREEGEAVYEEASEKEQELLIKRLAENYEAYIQGLRFKSLHELVELVEEIAAVQFVYKGLTTDVHFRHHTEYLLGFENLLKELVACYLTERECVNQHDQLDGALWKMRQDATVSKETTCREEIKKPYS